MTDDECVGGSGVEVAEELLYILFMHCEGEEEFDHLLDVKDTSFCILLVISYPSYLLESRGPLEV